MSLRSIMKDLSGERISRRMKQVCFPRIWSAACLRRTGYMICWSGIMRCCKVKIQSYLRSIEKMIKILFICHGNSGGMSEKACIYGRSEMWWNDFSPFLAHVEEKRKDVEARHSTTKIMGFSVATIIPSRNPRTNLPCVWEELPWFIVNCICCK